MNNLDIFTSEVASELNIDKNELIENFQLHNSQNWDSFGLIVIMGLIDKHFQYLPKFGDVIHCRTFGDLLNLVKNIK